MNALKLFIRRFSAGLATVAIFNLIIGVCGLSWAMFTLAGFIIFAVYTSFQAQPEEKEPHA